MEPQPIFETRWEEFTLSTDKARLDFDLIHDFLSNQAYWSPGVPMEVVRRAAENSLCFGIYYQDRQVGFARVISDFATFAYLADVFILEDYRGRGLSKWMLSSILAFPQLQNLRRWILATRDAHNLYARFGFQPLKTPERLMEINRPDIYRTTP